METWFWEVTRSGCGRVMTLRVGGVLLLSVPGKQHRLASLGRRGKGVDWVIYMTGE